MNESLSYYFVALNEYSISLSNKVHNFNETIYK